MLKKSADIELNRLKSMLLKDKVSTPTHISEVIKSDIYDILANYMELFSEDLKVDIECDERSFIVNIKARTARFKQIGALPKQINK